MAGESNTIEINENPVHVAVQELVETINSMPNSMTNKQEHIVIDEIWDDIEKLIKLLRDAWKACGKKCAFSAYATLHADTVETLKKALIQKSKLVSDVSISNDNKNSSFFAFLKQCATIIDQVMKSKDCSFH